jgi:hypothetical protein
VPESIRSSAGGSVKQYAILSALMVALLSGAASADTITFSTAAGGAFTGPTVEGDFSYALFGGGLFVDLLNGNPSLEMEGFIPTNGGTLQIVRNDVAGGLFTFDEADVQQFNFGAVPVVFEGYLGGALQASDSLLTSASSLTHTTLASSNLSGVAIDELRILLDASSSPSAWEGVDNVDLTPVPEPGTLVLVGAGLVALQLRERTRRRA